MNTAFLSSVNSYAKDKTPESLISLNKTNRFNIAIFCLFAILYLISPPCPRNDQVACHVVKLKKVLSVAKLNLCGDILIRSWH